ncbi:MAG: 2-phosphosulfolactate phosphatase [Planctomycetaceae bacterium]|nr:2-phosphosulfolactate phosphatase [Planctomycetaceae bacterium]
MTQRVSVHMLPSLIEAGSLAGGVSVVIDVLRATTTIVHALANGAEAVVPCESIEQALEAKAAQSQSQGAAGMNSKVLLGGERHGELIPGFDLDNSPFAYSPEVVAGKTIIFTTTNGTRALHACRTASRVLIGAFVNHASLVRILQADGRPVHLVCAGTDGQLTAEDILFAGAVAVNLLKGSALPVADVQTQMAVDFFQARSGDSEMFLQTLRNSRGGQNLLHLGMDADVQRASQWNLFEVVPEWHAAENRIVAARPT